MTVSTSANGKWYSIVGTVSEVMNELNVKNFHPEDVVVAGDDGSGSFTLIIGRP